MASEGDDRKRIDDLERRVQAIEAWQRAQGKPLGVADDASAEDTGVVYDAPQQADTAWKRVVDATQAPQSSTPKRRRDPRSLEDFLGANLLPKIGVTVLVLGVVFLLKLAFDQGWIGPAARIWLGILGGLGLVGLGDWLHRSPRFASPFPEIVVAGGFVIAYAASWVGFQSDDYRAAVGWGLGLSGSLFGALAVAPAAYAWHRRAEPLGAVAGGLVGISAIVMGLEATGSVYFLVGATAMLVLAAGHRGWRYAPVSTMFAAFGALFFLTVEGATPGTASVGAGFLFVVATFAAWWTIPGSEVGPERVFLAGFSLLAAWGVVTAAYFSDWSEAQFGWLVLGAALVGLALAALARSAPVESRQGWLYVGAVLGFAWPPIHFDGNLVVIAWSVFLVIGAFVMTRREVLVAPFVSFLAAFLLMAHLIIIDVDAIDPMRSETVVRALVPFGAAAAALITAWSLLQTTERRESIPARILLGFVFAVPLIYLGEGLAASAITIAWAIEAALAIGVGFLLRIGDLRIGGLVVFAFVLARLFLYDLSELDPVFRIISYMVIGVLALVVSGFFAARRRGRPDRA